MASEKKEYTSFIDKYTPKTTSSVVGNKDQIYQIKDWIDNYDTNREKFFKDPKKRKNKKKIIVSEETEGVEIPEPSNIKKITNTGNHSCLFIAGDHGVGKTCTVFAILRQINYSIQLINLTKIGTNKNKNIENCVDKILNGNNIIDHLTENKHVKVAIIVDEVESANSPVEKNFILTLLKKNEESWYCPIIFISNGKHSRIATVLKKNSNIVQFFQPSSSNLMKMLIKVCHAEKIHFESEKIASKITDHCQKDYRRLLSTLQDLQINYGKQVLTDENIDQYCSLSKKKDTDVHIFKAAAEMILNYQSIDECLRLYEGEKVIIPLVMHQNYIKCINNYHKNGNEAFVLANDIAISIATGDLIENYIYSDQNWDMQEVHGFLTCVNPSFKLSNEKFATNEEYLSQSLGFPIDLNRTSIKKINHKNVVNSNMCLKNLEIKDFIYANRLIRKLLQDNKLEECANLFDKYAARVENIESVLKIDKINETKTVIPTQIKKKLTQLLAKQDM